MNFFVCFLSKLCIKTVIPTFLDYFLLVSIGVHRVQRVPKTESKGRIHTSTVGVVVTPKPEKINIELNPKDLNIETKTSGGPGGQHANKTLSAVRLTHLPTGN